MAHTDTVDVCDDLSFLLGRTIHAVFVEYHAVALRLDNDEIVNFSTEECVIAKWFEVFPIKVSDSPTYEFSWMDLKEPFTVQGTAKLWREEWLEPVADDGSFMGSGPHSAQFAEPLGSAPMSASHVAKVHAGIKLLGAEGRYIVVCSSINTPFKIDLAVEESDSRHLLRWHSCT